MNRSEQRLLPPGRLTIHTQMTSPANAEWSKEDAAWTIAAMNTPEYLRGDLLNMGAVYRKAIDRKGVCQIKIPKSPYGPGGLMVIAADNRLFDPNNDKSMTENGIVPTTTIYDYDVKLQKEYFRQTLAAMLAMEEFNLPDENPQQDTPRVLATENNMAIVSNESHRVPRSIGLPHLHVFKAGSWIDTTATPKFPPHLRAEQRLLRRGDHLERFATDVSSTISDELGRLGGDVQISLRDIEPFGYAITTPITRNQNLDDQAEILQKVMASHQKAYMEATGRHIDGVNKRRIESKKKSTAKAGRIDSTPMLIEEKIIPQPSMRTYLYFNNRGFLTCVISPEFISSAGVMEAAGVILHRDATNDNPYQRGEIGEFRKKVKERIKSSLDPHETTL